MANTTADKLALLEDTKAAMKSAINGSGSTVGDVFSAYPAAITSGKAAIAQATTNKGVATASTDTFAQMAANIEQIETTSLPQMVTVEFSLPYNNTRDGTTVYYYTISDASVVAAEKTYPRNDMGVQELDVLKNSYLVFDKAGSYISGRINMTPLDSWGSGTSGGSLFLA